MGGSLSDVGSLGALMMMPMLRYTMHARELQYPYVPKKNITWPARRFEFAHHNR